MSHPINEPTGVDDHPDWCDPTLCTVTPAADVLQDHRGQPVTVRAKHGFPVPLTVTVSASGTPRAVLRPGQDVIDLVRRGGRVPATLAEARDIEDQVCAILTIFGPQPGERADSDVTNDILYREHRAREHGQPGAAITGGKVNR